MDDPPLRPLASSPVLVFATPSSILALAEEPPEALLLEPIASLADDVPVEPVLAGRALAFLLTPVESDGSSVDLVDPVKRVSVLLRFELRQLWHSREAEGAVEAEVELLFAGPELD